MDVAAELEGFIRGNFFYDGPPLAPDTSLMESGILDSTGVLELVGFLEERFGFKVEDAELTPENLDSLGRLQSYVARKRNGHKF